jgi:DNA replication and repair protein RecF
MLLRQLRIRRFRNLGDVQLSLNPGPQLLWGANAQGKTNILESIYFLVTGRSFRTRHDRECIPDNAEDATSADAEKDTETESSEDKTSAPKSKRPDAFTLIEGEVARQNTTNRLRIVISSEGKQVFSDNQPLPRLGQLWGKLNAVLFTPADLALVQGGPAGRRRFLDTELAQVSPIYLDALQRYDRALRQRNTLLRRNNGALKSPEKQEQLKRMLRPYEQPLAEAACTLVQLRQQAIDFLGERCARYYQKISGGREPLELLFEPSLNYSNSPAPQVDPEDNGEPDTLTTESPAPLADADFPDQSPPAERVLEEPDLFETRRNPTLLVPQFSEEERDAWIKRFLQQLAASVEKDLRRSATGIGPHRDDFTFRLQGRNARDFASQGQQRSCVLALRFSEIDLMRATTGETPLLLLDDIVSELDDARRAALLGLLPRDIQTIITATNAEALEKYLPGLPSWEIKAGAVQAKENPPSS